MPHDWIRREVPPEKLLEAAPDAMIVTDENGSIVYMNSEAEKLFGYDRDELLRQPVEVLIPEAHRGHHAGHRRAFHADPRARPMGKALDIVGLRRDGSEFPADIKLSPLPMPSGFLVTAAIRDISAQKKAAARLQTYAAHLEALQATLTRKNIELEQRNSELEQFAYVSSHDLQEPLRKIVAFGDRLQDRCSEGLDDRGRDYLARMQSAARRMQLLINDLLEFSRLTTRGRPFERVDLRHVAETAVADLEIIVERTGGRVEIGEIGAIDTDPLQMRQLLQNLVANALKFHREGEPPRVRVWGQPAPA
ncbi:MAG TPA: PAS domain S-box protein, partial [Candidatus Nanopelagicales bacterium]|nr:PAS domain S-box protein [Candidatus Nanopelagicales bacterium]